MVEQVEIKQEETTAEKPVEETSDRPEWLPEKFNSPEDMAKAYGELETKLGQPKEAEAPKEEPKQQESKQEESLEIAEKAVESAGLDMGNLQTQYNENGKLDDSSYESLEKAGIPKDYVDAFIEGQKALATQQQNEVKGIVGGDEAYKDMSNWASTNMTEGEKKAYNQAVNSRDMNTVKLAVEGLKAKYEQANGIEPSLVQGKASATSEQGYRSWAEVTSAMNDSRYSSDPAYQSDVKAKLANSKL